MSRVAAAVMTYVLLWGLMGALGTSAVADTGQADARDGAGGTVLAWGRLQDQDKVPAEALEGVTAISSGLGFSIALKSGRVIVWGGGPSLKLIPSAALSGVTSISAGENHALALKDGRVLAWGENEAGQTDVPPDAQSGVDAIAAGSGFSLALKDGRVISWGRFGPESVPEDAQSGIVAISAGMAHALALGSFGRVIAWGSNTYGETTIPEEAEWGVSAISAGGNHSVALKDGKIITWGSDDGGQQHVPSEAQSGVSAIAAGASHTLAIKNGRVIAWGWNNYRQSTVPIAAQSGVTSIAASSWASMAIRLVTQVPARPRSVTATRGNGEVTVSWDNAGPSDEFVSSYLVTSEPEGKTCETKGETSCIVRDLNNGTAYRFTVVARNPIGTSEPSVPSASVIPVGPPDAPRGVLVQAGNGEATVSWEPSRTLGAGLVTTYTVVSSPGLRRCSVSFNTQCTVEGLTNGVGYRFQVIATNDAGSSQPAESEGEATPDVALPTSPQEVKVRPISGALMVSWNAPASEGASPVVSYTVVASPGARTCVTKGDTSCTVDGLINGTPYSVVVTARSQSGVSAGSQPSNPVAPAKPAVKRPGVVSSLKATPKKGAVRITWKAPKRLGGDEAVTYRYRVSKGPWKSTKKTSVRVRGRAGRLIAVSVRAVNSAGPGKPKTVRSSPL